MTFLNKISTMFFRNKSAYQVGQRLYSSKKRKSLVLEREIFVNDIKHFRVRIEGMIIKKAVILSESALFQDHSEHIEDISDKKMLLQIMFEMFLLQVQKLENSQENLV